MARGSYRLLAETHAAEDFLSVDELSAYWEVISYDLSPEHLAGVRQYFADAQQIGALERVPELRFISESL
jgi:chorismate dehydratase